MKKVWIFFCLAGSHCQKWLLWCLSAMIIVQSSLFAIGLGQNQPFDTALPIFWMQNTFLSALLVMVIRMSIGGLGDKRPTNLLRRLDAKKYQIFLGFFLHALVTFFLLWALQVALLWSFSLVYSAVYPNSMGPQTVFLLTHNVPFFHGLLPTLDITHLIFALLSWIGLSTVCATSWRNPTLALVANACVLPLFQSSDFQYMALSVGLLLTCWQLGAWWMEDFYE